MPVSGPDTLDDLGYMRRALDFARDSVGLASPNPVVGCVLVREGEVLAEGAHHYDARDHAEIVALKAANARGLDPAGATAYVTLEPCSHHGRTGPCADALIAARVGRLVTATLDPNPLVRGQGVDRIRAAGIPVRVGVGLEQARELNAGFASWIVTGRPYVTLKAALSADGMLAPHPNRRTPGETFWLSSPPAREEVQRLRHAADAVLTGIGTVLADDPLLTDRSGHDRRRPLLRVVLDSTLRTPLDSRLVRTAASTAPMATVGASGASDVLILCGPEAPAERFAALVGAGVQVVALPGTEGRIDLGAVLDLLGRRQILDLLLECGSELNGAFLTAGLVDRVVLFTTPAELGPDSIPFAAGFGSLDELASSLTGLERTAVGPDTRVSGTLRDPWPVVR